jgi:phosphoadenosine phosphosulfate reductase
MPYEGSEAGLAETLNARLRDAHPSEILKTAMEMFGHRLALVSSFGTESAVLLHLAAQIDPTTPVLFLDTGHLFGQTLDYRKALAQRLGLTVVRDLRPAYTDIATQDPTADLYKTSTDACCEIRKVLPLDRALHDFDGWVTGRKRFHGGDRLRLPVVEEAEGKIKFNPLANWGRAELDAYAREHNLPDHPLKPMGYPSVGCWPCTQPSDDADNARAGRWAGQEKTECGIHVSRARTAHPVEVGGDI